MNKEQKDVFEIFFDSIERDAIFDLNRMLDLVDYSNSQGRLAVPIALTIFSLLDLFGFIVSKDNDVNQTSKNWFSDNSCGESSSKFLKRHLRR